jgi:citrate lyase subunit beta / citryl-CoA lyase
MTHVRSSCDSDRVRSARSVLFVPGDRPERFAKARASGADLVVVDLEDAVAPARRGRAREAVRSWLSDHGESAVRINAVGTTDHEADVTAVCGLAHRREGFDGMVHPPIGRGLIAVMVAKAEEPSALTAVAHATGAPVIALIETAVGLAHAAQIASAPGVERLALGHLDLAVDLDSDHDRTAMLYARSSLVLASRAAHLTGPLDGVTVDLNGPAAVESDARYAHGLGMTGKLLVHPRQVGPVHAAFQPTTEELAWAEAVISTARGTEGGAVARGGVMIDRPVFARAEKILRRAGCPV